MPMSFDEIVAELRSSTALPREALREAASHGADFLPLIAASMERAKRGVHLIPAENQLLFYALHVAAAAGVPELAPRVRELLHLPQREIEVLLGDATVETMTPLLLSTHADETAALMDLALAPDLAETARWSVFHALARFAFEGRIGRVELAALLARFEAEAVDPPGALAWIGWADAVSLLGFVELEPALHRVWQDKLAGIGQQAEMAHSLECLAAAAADPRDDRRFSSLGITPVGDVVERLAWIDAVPIELPPGTGEPVAGGGYRVPTGLTEDDLAWLTAFLDSRQVPEATMSVEMLDGFFTGLLAGPDLVPLSTYLPVIFGGSSNAVFEDREQAAYVLELFQRHWNAIARGLMEGSLDEPLIFDQGDGLIGSDWGHGFLEALDLQPQLDPRDKLARRAARFVEPIAALAEDASLTRGQRQRILDRVADFAIECARIWRPASVAAGTADLPVRVEKVGRNDPCPCGSGTKFKKCCGASVPPSPTRH